MITDILYRLPFKSLSRFKCVSPSWNTLISDTHFAIARFNRTKTNYHPLKAILFTRSLELYFVDFAEASLTPKKLDAPSFNHMDYRDCFRSVSSCNGMVLVSDEGYANFLFNPSTGEFNELPEPFKTYSSMDVFFPPGLGYVSCTDDYKVVMPFFKEGQTNPNEAAVMMVAVYSLKNNTWRTIQDFPYDPVRSRPGVCFNEHLHWLCERTGGLDYSEVVVAFGLADETLREVQLPSSYDDNEFRGHDMVVLGGCLCLLDWSMGDRIDVWMMMEYGVRETWANYYSIPNPGRSIKEVLCLSAQDELVLRRERLVYINGRLEDKFDGAELVLYNLRKGTRREVLVPGIPTTSLVGDHYYIETT